MSNYDDIINLPHHISKNHPRMSQIDRAAQFAPFAALTGYAESINEAGRYVDKKKELSDEQIEDINNKLKYLLDNIEEKKEATIIHFVKDLSKDGGFYQSIKGIIKKIDSINRLIFLTNKTKIYIDNILYIIL
ncbi:MAG: hypothetical protein ACI35S_00825 [Anaeroplasma sp.]